MEQGLSTKPAPRTPVDHEVLFKRNYSRVEARVKLKNISVTGAFIEMDENERTHVKAQDKIYVRLAVAGRERKLAAQVVWLNKSGCGIKFIPHTNRDTQLVDDFIYFAENSRADSRDLLSNIIKNVA